MIEVRDLVKRFGKRTAVDSLCFWVEAGTCFGLLGPNGAGKTTTIHMMAGLLEPDGGSVLLEGEADPTRSSLKRRIGVAPQSVALYDELSGKENLEFFGRLQGLSGNGLKERVGSALELVGLGERAGDRVAGYSGGMKRRLNLAAALLHDPAVLMLDEPTAGVDPQSRNRIFENVEALKKRGTTILYTTHYLEEAENLCDRVAILDHGRLLAIGTVDELVREHGGDSILRYVTRDGGAREVSCKDPLGEIARLGREKVEIREVQVRRPGLESVFLHLTGRNLRDG